VATDADESVGDGEPSLEEPSWICAARISRSKPNPLSAAVEGDGGIVRAHATAEVNASEHTWLGAALQDVAFDARTFCRPRFRRGLPQTQRQPSDDQK
jgi:hypothetical protein